MEIAAEREDEGNGTAGSMLAVYGQYMGSMRTVCVHGVFSVRALALRPLFRLR